MGFSNLILFYIRDQAKRCPSQDTALDRIALHSMKRIETSHQGPKKTITCEQVSEIHILCVSVVLAASMDDPRWMIDRMPGHL